MNSLFNTMIVVQNKETHSTFDIGYAAVIIVRNIRVD